MLYNCIRGIDALEKIPSVITVVPGAATDIVVSCAGELFIREAIGVAAKISNITSHMFIVKIIMAIHVLNDVIPAYFHLATGIGRTVYIKVLK